jgi:hypothetical protein
MSALREHGTWEGMGDEATHNEMDERAGTPVQHLDESPGMPQSNVSPPSFYDIDRLSHRIDLQEFGKDLQVAVNAVFSGTGHRRSRYSQVCRVFLCPLTTSRLVYQFLDSETSRSPC